MEINQDVRALVNSTTNLPKAFSMYLAKNAEETEAEAVAHEDIDDVDAELSATLSSKGVLAEELQALVNALASLEARAVDQPDAAKKAVLLVQCRMAANNLKVEKGQSTFQASSQIVLPLSTRAAKPAMVSSLLSPTLPSLSRLIPHVPSTLFVRCTRRTWTILEPR